MPLHDHFRPPGNRLPWRPLHNGWISELATRINSHLPDGYLALDAISIDGGLEVDVGIEEEFEPEAGDEEPGDTGGTAVATARTIYTPPPATATAHYQFPEVIELRVTSERDGRLVGAIEMVSPGNKDRGAKRDMFIAKCLDYLAGGACVVIVDVITSRRANLHNEIIERLGGPESLVLPEEANLYAATYRPIVRKKKFDIDVWVTPVLVGGELPTMPMRVVAGLFVPVELEAAYAAACRGRKFNV
ncbi:hypothetical protein GobsT_21160 [Gemmata obscuriglobus]|uniref:DUF4058 domain-containing protein n=1 Tax=Gemmata obscuriglobus TaxID=114 RepID=A0A2Z3H960_9BACT|nr:DUF4058 family protein [Gemmata obscuriglobus]AWM39545.1 DUF4058 domain-containing protein [Gemmata obscuriglobus]QEG27362.1 hypothetical protein GobsT_21160 [Gemmata obscuriglobus]VTS04239.1 Uncharacterized protein OS=Candidatus Entotheonella sp. TSY1 GN=ETSY1_33795 PE=4 SV=1 [Gemmata obscuriglobus UQM 2246]